MAQRKLNVFLYGRHIGVLTGHGLVLDKFEYDRNYVGVPLSLSMPTSVRSLRREGVNNWFGGLLPEGRERRLSLAEAFGSRDVSTIGILERAGLDCAGAVQLAPERELPDRGGAFSEIDERQIGRRLRAAMGDAPVEGDGERWSLAGQQGKVLLHQNQEGAWGRAIDGLPTTHILKPGIHKIGDDEILDQALVEHVTLEAAKRLGIPAANTSFHEFDGAPAVVVERYDRAWVGGQCVRLHQEDLCQAAGKSSNDKYEEDGGPGVRKAGALIEQIASTPDESHDFRLSFAEMVMFNYLSGSPDGHSKNYSLLIFPGGQMRLAPMYDSASGFPYSYASGAPRFRRAAMKIGLHNRFGEVADDDWGRFASDLGLRLDEVLESRDRIAGSLPDALSDAIARSEAPNESKARLRSSPLLLRTDRNTRSVLLT